MDYNNIQYSGKNISIIDWIIIFCLIFSGIASMSSDNINRLALYGALPLAFVLSYLKVKTFRINKYSDGIFLLFSWIALSYSWAVYKDYANIELHRVLGAFLVCFIMAVNARDRRMLPWLYLTYIALYLGAWNYASSHLVIDVSMMDSDTDRLNDAKLNANTMAYYTFYVTFVFFVYGEILENKFIRNISKIMFIAMIPISFFVALTTASRQVLIIQIPLISFLLYIRYFKQQSSTRKGIFVLAVFGVAAIAMSKVVSLYENSYLAVRASTELQEDSRFLLMEDAFKVAMDNLPFGVGAGNYIAYSFNKHFSHISYIELLANQGIIGCLLYIYILVSFAKRQYKRYRVYNDRMLLLFLLFGFIFIVDNVFYVFYNDIWLISFLLLVATHSETYYNEKYGNS